MKRARYEPLKEVPLRDPSSIKDQERSTRVDILNDTVALFSNEQFRGGQRAHYTEWARENLLGWSQAAQERKKEAEVAEEEQKEKGVKIIVEQSDLLDAVAKHTKRKGQLFAALNMANETYPGGGYTNGRAAQEENMARRTDMHFTFNSNTIEHDWSLGRVVYKPEMQRLINGSTGHVYLSEQPLVCIKGSETWNKNPTSYNFGYRLLDRKEVFPFLELRSAALDVARIKFRVGEKAFDRSKAIAEMKGRIKAQFTTLATNGVRNVVLSAFGCGAFGNSAVDVANLYKQAIADFAEHLDTVVFAIFYAGHGANNYDIFNRVLSE